MYDDNGSDGGWQWERPEGRRGRHPWERPWDRLRMRRGGARRYGTAGRWDMFASWWFRTVMVSLFVALALAVMKGDWGTFGGDGKSDDSPTTVMPWPSGALLDPEQLPLIPGELTGWRTDSGHRGPDCVQLKLPNSDDVRVSERGFAHDTGGAREVLIRYQPFTQRPNALSRVMDAVTACAEGSKGVRTPGTSDANNLVWEIDEPKGADGKDTRLRIGLRFAYDAIVLVVVDSKGPPLDPAVRVMDGLLSAAGREAGIAGGRPAGGDVPAAPGVPA